MFTFFICKINFDETSRLFHTIIANAAKFFHSLERVHELVKHTGPFALSLFVVEQELRMIPNTQIGHKKLSMCIGLEFVQILIILVQLLDTAALSQRNVLLEKLSSQRTKYQFFQLETLSTFEHPSQSNSLIALKGFQSLVNPTPRTSKGQNGYQKCKDKKEWLTSLYLKLLTSQRNPPTWLQY